MISRILLTLLCWSILTEANAAQRKPKRLELPPEIHIQMLEKRLAEGSLGSAERAKIAVALARNYFRAGELLREAEVLEDALAAGITDPKLAAEARYYLGRTYQSLGAADSAADQFEMIWNQFPGSSFRLNAAMELGDLVALAGETNAAMDWYSAVIEENPKAKISFLARDKRRALDEGIAADEIVDESGRPVYDKQLYRRLDQYLYSQLYDNADAVAEQLLSSRTRTNAALRAAANFHLAHHYWMYGHLEGAEKFLSEAIKTRGDCHTEALVLAGHIKRGLGDDDAALGYYRQAIQSAPAKAMTITAYQQSVRLLLRQGKEKEALSLADSGKRAFGSKQELPAYLDRISNTLRDRAHPQWRTYAAQVAATATNDLGYRAVQKLAKEAVLRHDLSAAQAYYTELSSRPVNDQRQAVEARLALLRIHLQQTNTAQAAGIEAELVNALGRYPDDESRAYVVYRLGKTFSTHQTTEKAQEYFSRAMQDYPDTKHAAMGNVQLARLYEASGDLPGATAAYESYLRRPELMPVFKLHAYAQLVRLKEAQGEEIASHRLLSEARTIALQSRDAKMQLNLAQYFRRYGDKALAAELLEQGLANVEARLKTVKDPHRRLRWVYLVARRLDDADDHGKLANWLRRFEKELLENKALDQTTRHSCYFLLIRALENTQRHVEAEALCEYVARSIPEDSERLAHIFYRLSQQAANRGETVKVRELAASAYAEQPNSQFAQHLYMQSAVEDFNSGRYDDALAKVAQLERSVPVSEKGWAAGVRWECQYLKGRSLVALGNDIEGKRQVNQALAEKPDLIRQLDLVDTLEESP